MYFRYITGAKKNFKKMTYTSAFESAGIGLLNYIHSRPIPALLRMLE